MKIDQASLKVGDRVKYSARSIVDSLRPWEGTTFEDAIPVWAKEAKARRGMVKAVEGIVVTVEWDDGCFWSGLAYLIERA